MKMLEKMARAACSGARRNGESPCCPNPNDCVFWDKEIPKLRAVIEEMMLPSNHLATLILAGRDELLSGNGAYPIYRAMLQAILDEGET